LWTQCCQSHSNSNGSTSKRNTYQHRQEAQALHCHGSSAATTTEGDNNKKPKVQKPPLVFSDGRPGVWLDEDVAGDGCWVQLGDHVFMGVECSKKNMRDPASFKVAAAAAEGAGGSAGSNSSNSSNSSNTHLVWLFRVDRFEGNSMFGRVYQNAARNLAQPLQLQRRSQELCSNKISSILHVLQPSDSSSEALETLTKVEAAWMLEVQAGLCAVETWLSYS
jgi:hypothetical protein